MGKIFTRELEEDSTEYLKSIKENQEYIDTHIRNVNLAFHNIIKPVFAENVIPGYTQEETNRILKLTAAYVAKHDKSKYTDDEFPYYRQHFYPTEKEKNASREEIEEMDRLFAKAWRHHYTHNDHHPQFWCNTIVTETYEFGAVKKYKILEQPKDPVDMSIVSIIHMIADWTAMGIPHNEESPWEWYTTKAVEEKAAMTDNTKRRTEELMTIIFPGYKDKTSKEGD